MADGTGQVDYNALAQQSGAVTSTPPPQASSPAAANADGSPDYDALAAQAGAINSAGVDVTGQETNDVGNTVIVPKDGESFSDTVKRATDRTKAIGPAQQQQEIDKEVATMPGKTAETLAGAAGIGLAGPGALALVGEIGPALQAARQFAQTEAGKDLMKLVLKHTGEKLLTGAGIGVGYEAIHKAAGLLGLIEK